MKFDPVKLLEEMEEHTEAAGRQNLALAIIAFFFTLFLVFCCRDRLRNVTNRERLRNQRPGLKSRNRRR